jgi:4-amino-4-deoxy-L-arabinose transferase-like glycosyltransferase
VTSVASEASATREEADACDDAESSSRARVVWWTAAVVGAVFLGLIVWQALVPRVFLAGSNSIGFRSVVTELAPGHTLCVRGLDIPDGTGGVRFAMTAQQPRVSAELRVVAGGHERVSRATGHSGVGGRIELNGHFAPLRVGGDSAAGKACLTPRSGGVVGVGGMAGLQGDQVPALLDGAPLAQRISVWFLSPAGERRSLVAAAGDVFGRVTRFRPGVVGPWLYPLLLLGAIPLVSLGGVVLLARTAAGRRSPLHPALAIALIAFVNAAGWALVTPPFEGPDEGDHAAYAQQVAETGHQLREGAPAYSSDLALALDGVRAYSHVGLGDARPPWLAADERRWESRRAAQPHPRDDGGGPTVATAPNTPLYYALLAPAYRATRAQSVFSQLTAMRLVSALFGALIAVCTFGIVRELLPGQPFAAVGAGLLVAFQPMLTFMAGVVNNDSGVNALAALVLYLVVRVMRCGPTWRSMLALGAALAALPLMKSTGYALYPPVALGLAVVAWRYRRRIELPAWGALAGAFAVVRGGWALLVPTAHYADGAAGTGSSLANVQGALEMPKQYALYLWQTFLPRLPFMHDLFPQAWPAFGIYVEGGWAAFGWLTIRFSEWVYVVVAGALLAVGALALTAVVRERAAARPRAAELLVIAFVPLCVLAAVAAALFAPQGRVVPAEQGRYAFTAVAALATVAVGGTFGLGRRWHVPLLTTLVVAVIGFAYASRLVALEGFFT